VGVLGALTITVGSTEHAAELLLPHISRAFAAHLPGAHVKFRLDRGTRLNEALDRSAIDVAVLIGDARVSDGEPAGELPLSWFAAPGWAAPRQPSAVPVVVIDEPCTIRRKALNTLAEAHRAASIVGEAGHLAGVLNAARAGVGVALLADVGRMPEGLDRCAGLPDVGPEQLHVRSRRGADPVLARVTSAAVRAALAR
jgi:DNA-binding transcriptional LysR family regulator